MAYTKITRTANGREALHYALNGRGHDGSEQRNLYVGSVNMLPPDIVSYAQQMERYWIRADGKNKTQINRIIASFSPDELDPDDPESPLRAAQICEEFVQEYYPGRQAVICIQNDGKGHKLHAHMLVSNVSMCEVHLPGERAQKAYAGCKGHQLKFDYVKENFDKVAEKYISLDQGEKAQDKATQNERRMHQHNAELAEGKPAKYIWKDDLKERVKSAMSEASDKEDFLKKLTEHGVEGTFHETKKGRKYYTYELTDISGFGEGKVPQNLRARSYKMGTDYDYETIDKLFSDEPDPAPKIPAVQSDPVPHTAPSADQAAEHAQDAIKALSAPQTGFSAASAVEIATTFGKRKNKPSSASRDIQKDAPAPGGGKPRFGKRSYKKEVQSIQKIVPDIQKDPPAKEQAPPSPNPRQEAERQQQEKERMKAENRKRQEALRLQTEKNTRKPIYREPTVSESLARAFDDIEQRERSRQKENKDVWDLYY